MKQNGHKWKLENGKKMHSPVDNPLHTCTNEIYGDHGDGLC